MTLASTSSPTSIQPATAGSNALSSATGDFSTFLKLLTTQMQNQDPLNPMDSTAYTQQLAQYSQVEQSIQQTGLLKDLLGRLSMQDMAQAAGLVGKTVTYEGSTAIVDEQGATWRWSTARAPATLTADVVDAQGRVVRSLPLSPARGGEVHWDGKLPDGGQAWAGEYSLRLSASDKDGAKIPATVWSRGQVSQVSTGAAGLDLAIGSQRIPMSRVTAIGAG